MKKILLTLLCIAVFITGCNEREEIKTVDQVNIKELQKHKETMVGNNSAVGSIVSSLPGNSTNKHFELSNQSIKVMYSLKEHKPTSMGVKLSDYWLNNNNIEKNFLYNAAALFILVKNVEKVTLELDSEKQYSFTISKSELEKELAHPLNEYAEKNTLWKEEILNGLVKKEENRKAFFKKYPIKRN